MTWPVIQIFESWTVGARYTTPRPTIPKRQASFSKAFRRPKDNANGGPSPVSARHPQFFFMYTPCISIEVSWSFNVPIWHICVHLLLQPINHQPISGHCPVLRDPHHSSHTTRDHQSPLSERSHVTMLRGLMFPGSRRPAVGGNGPIFQQSLRYLFFHEAFWAHRAHGNLLYGWSVKKQGKSFLRFRIVLSQLVIWPASIWGASRGVKNVMSWEFQHLSWDPSHFGNFSHIFNSNPQEKHRKNQQLWNHYLIKWKELACFSYVFLWAFLCVLPFSKRNAHCTFVVRLPNGELATIWSGRIVKGKTRMKKSDQIWTFPTSQLSRLLRRPVADARTTSEAEGHRHGRHAGTGGSSVFGETVLGFKKQLFPRWWQRQHGHNFGKNNGKSWEHRKKTPWKSEKNLESTNG